MTNEIRPLGTQYTTFQPDVKSDRPVSQGFQNAINTMRQGYSPNGPMSEMVDGFFSYSRNIDMSLTNFDDFYTQYARYMDSCEASNYPSKDQLLNAFTADFASQLHLGDDPGWALATPPMNISTPEGHANCEKQFKTWFNKFLKEHFPSSFPEFFSTAKNQLDLTVSINNPSLASQSYNSLYSATFPQASSGTFESYFKAFYEQQVKKDGYFIPSEQAGNWQAFINAHHANLTPYIEVPPIDPVDRTSASKTACLNRLLTLLNELLGTMQSIAAVQSMRLVKSTDLQSVYTERLAELHVFLKGDMTKLGADTPEAEKIRADLNDHVNSTLRVLNENKRQMEADKAKGLMSNINQSSEAVSQLANMFTSIIQELTNLLSVVLRQG